MSGCDRDATSLVPLYRLLINLPPSLSSSCIPLIAAPSALIARYRDSVSLWVIRVLGVTSWTK